MTIIPHFQPFLRSIYKQLFSLFLYITFPFMFPFKNGQIIPSNHNTALGSVGKMVMWHQVGDCLNGQCNLFKNSNLILAR